MQCMYVLCNAPVIIAGVTGFSQILESAKSLQFWNISQQDRGSFLADQNSRKPCNSDNGYLGIAGYIYVRMHTPWDTAEIAPNEALSPRDLQR